MKMQQHLSKITPQSKRPACLQTTHWHEGRIVLPLRPISPPARTPNWRDRSRVHICFLAGKLKFPLVHSHGTPKVPKSSTRIIFQAPFVSGSMLNLGVGLHVAIKNFPYTTYMKHHDNSNVHDDIWLSETVDPIPVMKFDIPILHFASLLSLLSRSSLKILPLI